jgi:hypothetical protein
MKMEFINLYSTINISMAYLDPGSGSIFIQLLISAIVGAGFFIRAKYGSIKNIFKKTSDEPEKEEMIDDEFDV